MALIGDFLRAIGQLPDRRFLMVFLKSVGLTILLLMAMAAGFGWLASLIPTDLGEWWLVGQVTLPSMGFSVLAVGAVIAVSPILMIPVSAVFIGFFLEDVAAAVEAKHYRGLPPAREIGLGEGITGAIGFLGIVVLVNLVALIPYLILLVIFAPAAWLLIAAVNGYLLGREYFQLVAERHMPRKEAAALRARHSGRTWLAGFLMALPLIIPIMNLVIPVLGVATITHQFHRLKRD